MDKQLLQEGIFNDADIKSKSNGSVECLGRVFISEEARREYYITILREKLKDSEFRKIEGFPIGDDEDILALSDPPYYTACPNPFIGDFIEHYGKPYNPDTNDYHREPFAADVSEGKNDPIYNAHSYHTKVPHKAIMRYILHYTEPEDIVFDGFCGTGMAGVAAQLCGDKAMIESLGYQVQLDGSIMDEPGHAFSRLGNRCCVLNDLSPAATFISYNYNIPVNEREFELETKHILDEIDHKCGWMFKTLHSDGRTYGKIVYTIWSDVFCCPECLGEIVFWDAAVDKNLGKVRDEFTCPHCSALLTKRKMENAWVTHFDKATGQTIRQGKQIPVLINYRMGKSRFEKTPDSSDIALINKIEDTNIPYWFPALRMPEGDESRRNDEIGVTHVHHFYTKRNLHTLACLNDLNRKYMWLLTGILQRASKQHQIAISRIGGDKAKEGGATAGHRRGTLYIPSNQVEYSPIELIRERIKVVTKAIRKKNKAMSSIIITGSADNTLLPSQSVDYIFTDPPFGGNIMYSELNFSLESFLKVATSNTLEAITSKTQHKDISQYTKIMIKCFEEYYRVLKPGRWITVEFHNTSNIVWSAIQQSLEIAGFVVTDVKTLDKKIETHNQRTAKGTVNKDLAITAYKPNGGLEERFKLEAGTIEGVWDFVRTHLGQLPVFISHQGLADIIPERQNYMLYDRMVAFHVQRGVTVPMSAADFYAGLEQRFICREGMFFIPEQAAEYDKKRMTVQEVQQLHLFISDESSAIQWLRQQIEVKPQTFQELQPQFMKETGGGWQKHEKSLELLEILEQNFLRYDGQAPVPSQVHSYLSTNFKDLRNLDKGNPVLVAKAKDRWYVPDPNKAGDLEKLRERALLKEFDDYRQSAQRKLKVFRLEAVRSGFKKAWQEKDYKTIIEVATKIPENVLQEDSKLLMWYDQAITRAGVE